MFLAFQLDFVATLSNSLANLVHLSSKRSPTQADKVQVIELLWRRAEQKASSQYLCFTAPLVTALLFGDPLLKGGHFNNWWTSCGHPAAPPPPASYIRRGGVWEQRPGQDSDSADSDADTRQLLLDRRELLQESHRVCGPPIRCFPRCFSQQLLKKQHDRTVTAERATVHLRDFFFSNFSLVFSKRSVWGTLTEKTQNVWELFQSFAERGGEWAWAAAFQNSFSSV